VQFTWDVVGFNTDFLVLRLQFLNPWDISDNTQFDVLTVTFWGVDFFGSW